MSLTRLPVPLHEVRHLTFPLHTVRKAFPVLPPMRSLVAVGLMALCLAGCGHGPVGQLQPTNCGTPDEFRRCASHAQTIYAPVTPTALPATPAY